MSSKTKNVAGWGPLAGIPRNGREAMSGQADDSAPAFPMRFASHPLQDDNSALRQEYLVSAHDESLACIPRPSTTGMRPR